MEDRDMKRANYTIEDRTRLILAGQVRTVDRRHDGLFDVFNEGEGTHCIWNINEVLSFLNMPGVSSRQLVSAVSAAAARMRTNDLNHKDRLTPEGRDQVDFKKSLILGVDSVEAEGTPIYQAALDKKEIILRVVEFAQKIYTVRPILSLHVGKSSLRGGSAKNACIVPGGRTIWKYREDYYSSGCDEMVLADNNHLKGNRTNHGVDPRMWGLVYQAIEKIYLDPKGASPSAAHAYLETLVFDENYRRQIQGLAPLNVVSKTTIRNRIKKINSTARAMARDGERATKNDRLKGLTDTHALRVGECLEVDESKLSLMTVCKRKGWWEKFTEEEKQAAEEIEEIITTRLWLVLALDVASRLPLGWVLTDKPGHEATLEVLRMVTRDKTKEKVLYDCASDPAPAVGLRSVKTDNGSGLRNAAVKGATLGIFSQSVDCRSYHSGDRPYVERFFGTDESQVINLLHGYTGRKAGHLKGYDPIKNGVFDTDELFGILTRYFIDEYPLQRHGGPTMRGMRPIEAFNEANENYGCVPKIPEMDRRIHLGWRSKAIVSDEGVRVFGLPYWSPELQVLADGKKRKVTVYSDPDCVNEVTVLAEGQDGPILGKLAWTMMSDLTIAEALEYQAFACATDSEQTADYETRLMLARKRRYDDVERKGLEAKLPRSFMTIAEADAKARTIIHVRNSSQTPLPGTVPPGSIASASPATGVFNVGPGFEGPIDAQATKSQDNTEERQTRSFGRPKSGGKLK